MLIQDRTSKSVHRELLLALESARTRLAVAIAAETKSTPLDQWRYYLDTADRIRRFARKLRRRGFDVPQEFQDWIRALEALKRLPMQDKALRLCQILIDIVAELE
jgi:hypothetical protein